jgi:hypothetical protein
MECIICGEQNENLLCGLDCFNKHTKLLRDNGYNDADILKFTKMSRVLLDYNKDNHNE